MPHDLLGLDDPYLDIEVASLFAEVGDAFHVSISRSSTDGRVNAPGPGNVREVRVHLERRSRDGTSEYEKSLEVFTVPIDEFGMGSAKIVVPIPTDSPISYQGELFSVFYQLVVVTNIEKAIDHKRKIDTIVVPRGGLDVYNQPHPLRSSSPATP